MEGRLVEGGTEALEKSRSKESGGSYHALSGYETFAITTFDIPKLSFRCGFCLVDQAITILRRYTVSIQYIR